MQANPDKLENLDFLGLLKKARRPILSQLLCSEEQVTRIHPSMKMYQYRSRKFLVDPSYQLFEVSEQANDDLLRHPDFYRAPVNMAAVLDLSTHKKSSGCLYLKSMGLLDLVPSEKTA